jgi:hypothetical protein
MKATTGPRVKICCIASIDEAWVAIDQEAAAVGLVSEMPSGPGPITEDSNCGDCRDDPARSSCHRSRISFAGERRRGVIASAPSLFVLR